ncbi:DUF2163 domain-containing protein [Roseibium denhamense]|uniref:Bacteriophage phiJL001 Gp84 C-terminal domain-containing protein n=1 Tax=Roseibium denhamense TaxID=76305 RepID=A0ABY1PN49_9HYPH|nr:DUF2163 domain-containing protein [Roseibium denhamense]MTI05717.1 DUF2163 domain-containing protein [Roseibium denhamense]SMP36941.1 phage conserved hypothetical protein BR0599 [Roseibium denhamense]
MKQIDPSLAGHIAGRATTLASCWIVRRLDGTALGFTDHDRPLAVSGTLCQPQNALSATAAKDGPGLAVGGSEIGGAISSPDLTDSDLERGLWDNARVDVYLVNWENPDQTLLLRRAIIGEVNRSGSAFTAELRGLSHLLESRQGRVFSRRCDADLGDHRCKINLSNPAYQTEALVTASAPGWVQTGPLSGYQDGWFTGGRLTVLDGAISGFASEIALEQAGTAGPVFSLFEATPAALDAGTRIRVRAGCDKMLATCRSKFANHLNFQGFPHMPGADFVLSYPNSNTGRNDGSPLVD